MIVAADFDTTTGSVWLTRRIQVLTLRPLPDGQYRALCFSFIRCQAFSMTLRRDMPLEVKA